MSPPVNTPHSARAGLERDEALLHGGAFLSSVGVLLVAPYLAVYLTRDIGWSATAAGFVIGLGFWFTRVAGLAGGWACRRVRPLMVMHVGNASRVAGYLLLIRTDPPSITVGLVLTGTGAGLYFPAAKDLLIRVASGPRQLRALAIRNAAANVGVALGPLVGLAAFQADPRIMFAAAAGVFLVLTLSQLTLRFGEGEPRHPASARVPTMLSLRPLLLVAAFNGSAAILLESSFPQVVTQGGLDGALTALFLTNSVAVVVLQPLGVRLVTRAGGWALPLSGVAVGLGMLPFTLVGAGLGGWVVGVVLIAVAEVVVTLWLDDQVRHLPHPATVYGRLSLLDGFGGLAGATASSWLATRSVLAPDVFANALWVLAAGFLFAGALVAVFRPRGVVPSTSTSHQHEGESLSR